MSGAYPIVLLIGDVSGQFLSDPPKLVAGKLAPERCDSTSSVESRSSGISGRGEGKSAKHSRKPHAQQALTRLAPERCDSTSSVDSHSSTSRREGGEKGSSKHARKPQQVFSSARKVTEGEDEEEEDGGERKDGKTDSLSISVDWGALPSSMSISNGSRSNTPTTAPTGGFTFTSEAAEGEGKEASPTLVSLPLLYSARADTAENPTTAYSGGTSGSNPQKPPISAATEVGTPAKTQSLSVETPKQDDIVPAKKEKGAVGGSDSAGPPRCTYVKFCVL